MFHTVDGHIAGRKAVETWGVVIVIRIVESLNPPGNYTLLCNHGLTKTRGNPLRGRWIRDAEPGEADPNIGQSSGNFPLFHHYQRILVGGPDTEVIAVGIFSLRMPNWVDRTYQGHRAFRQCYDVSDPPNWLYWLHPWTTRICVINNRILVIGLANDGFWSW
jgi:hypothetical protein